MCIIVYMYIYVHTHQFHFFLRSSAASSFRVDFLCDGRFKLFAHRSTTKVCFDLILFLIRSLQRMSQILLVETIRFIWIHTDLRMPGLFDNAHVRLRSVAVVTQRTCSDEERKVKLRIACARYRSKA